MIDLDLLRHHINQMDQQLLTLLVQRLEFAKDVAEYKKSTETPVKDEVREAAILNDLKRSECGLPDEFIDAVWGAIFTESRRRQSEYLDQ